MLRGQGPKEEECPLVALRTRPSCAPTDGEAHFVGEPEGPLPEPRSMRARRAINGNRNVTQVLDKNLAHRATLSRGRGMTPLKAPHARCARAMPDHRFHVGQVVIYRPGVDAPSGLYGYKATAAGRRRPARIHHAPRRRDSRRTSNQRIEELMPWTFAGMCSSLWPSR